METVSLTDINQNITLVGKYTSAIIYVGCVEADVIKQVLNLCNHPLFKDSNIRVMPDTHPGKSTIVGLTCFVPKEHLIPSLLGSDLSCGVLGIKLKGKVLNDYAKLDKVIRNNIPSGAQHRKTIHKAVADTFKQTIEKVAKTLGKDPANYLTALGTLGGGNHFISIEKGETGTYLLIHTGSRNFGQDINIHYSKLALEENPYAQSGELKLLCWLNENSSKQYLEVCQIAHQYSLLNRQIIAQTIMKEMSWKAENEIDVPHNYIAIQNGGYLLRKGAIHIPYGKNVFIPLNMADGTLLVKQKDPNDPLYNEWLRGWNCSGPHGAGRSLSRQDAKEKLTMEAYKKDMKDVFSTCISVNTLDESPMAYKQKSIIVNTIKSCCDVVDELKPKYNFKAS